MSYNTLRNIAEDILFQAAEHGFEMDRLNLSSLLLVEVGQNFDPVLHRVLHVFLPVQMISQGVGSKNAEDRYEAVSCNLQSCLEEMLSGEPGRAILGGMSRHRAGEEATSVCRRGAE